MSQPIMTTADELFKLMKINSQQSQPKSSVQFSNNSRPRPQRMKVQPIKELNTQAQAFKALNPDYALADAKRDYSTKTGAYREAHDFVDHHNHSQRQYDVLLGRKIYAEVAKSMGASFTNLPSKEKKTLELLLIQDDFFSALKNIASSVHETVKPYIKPALQAFAPQFVDVYESFAKQSNSSSQSEEIRVSRKWQLCEVKQTVESSVQTIEINPGLRKFGQWLSLIARAYQYYRIHTLELTYIPATALTTQGNIMYYLEIDNNAPVPSQMEMPQQYKSNVHALYNSNSVSYTSEELHQGLKRLHCRNEPLQDQEVDQYDVGRFFYSCSNTSSTAYGQFYINVDISFYVPTLQNLSTDWVMQYVASYSPSTFRFPENNDVAIADLGLQRTINGNSYGPHRMLQTGLLRFGMLGKGTNAATIVCPIISVSDTSSSTLTQATLTQNWISQTAGDKWFYRTGWINVKAGQLIWIALENTGEATNNLFTCGIGFSSNFFPSSQQYLTKQNKQQEEISVLQQQLSFIQKLLKQEKPERNILMQATPLQPISIDQQVKIEKERNVSLEHCQPPPGLRRQNAIRRDVTIASEEDFEF